MSEEIFQDIKNIKSQETFTLPSKGLLYSKEDNIPASITLRRMTTKEDKIRLRNQSELTIRRDILQACILNEGVDTGKLKTVDANFLLFKLRSLSLLTDMYKIHCRCPFCKAEFINELNLNEIPINYLDKKKLENFSVILPLSKIKVNLKLPSLNDTIQIAEDFTNYKKAFPDIDASDYLYSITNGLYIKDINGNRLLKEEIPNFIDNLDILDNRELLERITSLQNLYGFEDDIIAECPACHQEVHHGLPITSELFSPSK